MPKNKKAKPSKELVYLSVALRPDGNPAATLLSKWAEPRTIPYGYKREDFKLIGIFSFTGSVKWDAVWVGGVTVDCKEGS